MEEFTDFSTEDSDTTLEPEFTTEGANERPVLAGKALDERIGKTHYGLGADSPGPEALKHVFASGSEDLLRQAEADRETVSLYAQKTQMVEQIAKHRGGALSPEEADLVFGLTQAEMKSDPATVLERKFAEKFTNDVLKFNATMMATDWNAEVLDEVAVGTKTISQIEYFKNKLHDLEAEAANQSWGGYAADFAGQMIPFLPWWRQKHALEQRQGVEFLMGDTMAENVTYMWSLPPDRRAVQYEAAMTYLKSKNLQDALAFARAMVAFPTSDQYIANTISMADYSTLGSFVGKLVYRGAAKAGTAAAGAVERPAWATPGIEEITARNPQQTVYVAPKQLDLFGEQPAQGQFRFMSTPDGGQPPWGGPLPPKPEIEDIVTAVGTYRGPGGKMQRARPRSTEYRDEDGVYSIIKMGEAPEVNPNTGIYRGAGGKFQKSTEAYRQGDLALGGEAPGQVRQGSFEFPLSPPAVREVRQVMADAVKAMEDPNPTVEKVLAATGRTGDAAIIRAAKEVTEGKPITTLADLAETLPSFATPGGFYLGARFLHRELADRLVNIAKTRSEKFLSVLTNAARGAYVTPEALAVANREAETFLRAYYNRFPDSVMDVRQTPADLHPMHIDTVTLRLSKPDGTKFNSADEALLYKNDIYGLGDEAEVRKIGNEWFIELDRHVDITSETVKEANLTFKNSLSTNMFKMLANKLLGADTLLPEFQQQQRKIAQHAQQAVKKQVVENLDTAYRALTKEEGKRLEQILVMNRDSVRAGRPDKRGNWYESAQEFEVAYVEKFGVTPRAEVVDAYYAYRQAMDAEWVMSNLGPYRDKAILGVEQHQFTAYGKKSGWFEGKLLDEMPWNKAKSDYDAGIWIQDGNNAKFHYMFDMTDAERKTVNDMIKDRGYRVVQVHAPQEHPLKGVGKTALGADLKEQIHYVVTNSVERKPLNFKQVDYEPGGHVIYKNDWYVAAPKLQEARNGKWTYLGDTPFLNAKTHAEAKQWAQRVNEAAALLRLEKTDELRAFIAAKLPYSYDEFVGMYRGPKAFLSEQIPVEFKKAGARTIDTVPDMKKSYDNGNLIDGTRNPHDLSSLMDKSFMMDRDHQLYSVLDGPKPTLVKAENLDPYTSLTQAFAQRFHNVWMNDYKIAAVQQWVQDAVNAGVMKPSEKTMNAHPMYFLYHPQWNPGVVNRELKAAVEAERQHIVNFIGQQTELGKNLQWLQTKMQDTVYNTLGQGKTLDAVVSATADPVSWMRAVAFHTKLGFFNPAQFFVQSQALAHVLAVAGPVKAMPGFAGGSLAQILANAPQHLDAVAKIASKFGWKAEDFKEMTKLLDRSGLYHIMGEATLRNDNFDMNLFRSKLGHILFDIGPTFFNSGERLVRLSAFATAYREFKAVNKTARIGDRELAEIINRSDLLSVNMTRASNASWQAGAASVPTQFFAFQARMMEQFVGKRLTPREKLRALATYSALYGVPIGAAVYTGVGSVWPVYDSLKEEAINRGLEFNSAHEKILTEGLLQYATYLATGKEFNVAQRLGPGNNTMIRDILSGDKAFAEIILGASGSILGDIIKSSYPLAAAAGSMFTKDSYPVTSEDFFRVARNISSLDMSVKQYHAIEYGKWITKNGTVVGPADSMDALMATMGLTSRKNADAFLNLKVLANAKNAQEWYEKDAMQNFKSAVQALNRGDTELYKTHMTRANFSISRGDFDLKQSKQIFERALQQNQDLADKTNWDLLNKAPASQYQKRLEIYLNRNQ
jgi:hypothetical protein